MCTLTWKPLDDGYALFFNRDELRSRPTAQPPDIHLRDGIRFIAPLDPQGGGSWLLVNEYGLSVALLNHYPDEPRAEFPAKVSRGALVMAAATSAMVEDAVARIAAMTLSACAPFRWVAADSLRARLLVWDGRRLEHQHLDSGGAMLTSSSWRTKMVEAARLDRLHHQLGTVRDADVHGIALFHRHRDVDDPARSVCMARPDACTQSISCIRVTPSEAMFAYEAVPAEASVRNLSLPLRLSESL
ncbi:NRDE family protein [Thiobacillus sp.]|uniref:NRDE family protein n=1 Tax=Thiobacillus sp. TaxID=924 RepID=UPI0011DA076F|nr:NRDE family protein [Thiobacillus sp.]TXH73994.1 MAG: hypothetical protein E6Q82_12170 [Thiobacillus sp.]